MSSFPDVLPGKDDRQGRSRSTPRSGGPTPWSPRSSAIPAESQAGERRVDHKGRATRTMVACWSRPAGLPAPPGPSASSCIDVARGTSGGSRPTPWPRNAHCPLGFTSSPHVGSTTPGCAARGPLSSPVTGDPGSRSCERQCRRQIRTSWHGALWPSGSDRSSTDQDGDCHVPGTDADLDFPRTWWRRTSLSTNAIVL